MSLNTINSDNYESFYLDYLEGNLSENDTIDLFAFLNEHPELRVDEDLPQLNISGAKLELDFKNLLKTDIYSQAISLNTIDLFLIAEKEGQLNSEQQARLTSFLAANPSFVKDQKIYAATTLQADQSIVFENKKELKQRGKVILWPYFSAVAAACAVLIIWMLPNSTVNLDAVSAAQDLPHPVKVIAPNSKDTNHSDFEENSNKQTIQRNTPGTFIPKQALHVPQLEKVIQKEKIANNIDAQSEKPTKLNVIESQKLNNITIALNPENEENSNNKNPSRSSDYGLAMKDVAPPVTRKLSEMIKKEVNLQRGTDAKGKREGVYFKIGTFEFYRNKKVKE